MNRGGREGRGESVWLGWFLAALVERFAPVCESQGDEARATRYRAEAARLTSMLDASWDGDWYRRGYFDDGAPLGSSQGEECRIDSLAQSWAILSGAAPPRRAEQAMDAVRTHLVRRGPQLVLLLTPAFDRSGPDPGYIRGYPPGVRENGGQYTHAAAWVVAALARLGSGDEAAELFHMLNPVNRSRTAADAERYGAEPYVRCTTTAGATCWRRRSARARPASRRPAPALQTLPRALVKPTNDTAPAHGAPVKACNGIGRRGAGSARSAPAGRCPGVSARGTALASFQDDPSLVQAIAMSEATVRRDAPHAGSLQPSDYWQAARLDVEPVENSQLAAVEAGR
jgi:hypothetical protein